MKMDDRIYGTLTIDTPVIVDLIHSKPMQRLKQIKQQGATTYIRPHLNVTRFEHSVGTWYLSHRYDRPIAEQIASLLHDIPHTAFSHVADYVFPNEKHEYHDQFIKEVIIGSEIPAILSKHDITLADVLRKEEYPLLDNTLPDISVDRWDYFMRDAFTSHLLSRQTIQLFLEQMHMRNDTFYFRDLNIATEFAILFLNTARLAYLEPTAHGSYIVLAKALRLALKSGIITQQDFFATDDIVMQKLRESDNEQIKQLLDRLSPGKEFHYAIRSKAEFYLPNKARYVDPWVEKDKKLVHVSDLIPGFADYLAEFKARYSMIGVVQDK